jgi:hypothetical protein
MSFFGIGRTADPSSTLGYTIDKKDTTAQMQNLKANFSRTTNKYINEYDKYKEIAKFNKQLSKSYLANLEVMVDVSKMLNMYIETIEYIKEQVKRAEAALGKPLDASDLTELSRLTKENINVLSNQFIEETIKLENLFGKNPEYRNEYDRVVRAREEIKPTPTLASETVERVNNIISKEGTITGPIPGPSTSSGITGGSKNKKAPPKKQKPKKLENKKKKKQST